MYARHLICKLAFAALLALPLSAFQAVAQVQSGASNQILTLNQERFFQESLFGRRVLQEIDSRSTRLAAENHRIESELKDEELRLTEQRKTLPAAEFRALADAFDAKVENIRTTQAGKATDLSKFADAEQQRFIDQAYPELLKMATEIGALVILDQRSIIITSGQIDVTERAIFRVDQAIGDGGAPPSEE